MDSVVSVIAPQARVLGFGFVASMVVKRLGPVHTYISQRRGRHKADTEHMELV